ncbi:PEST proteolytic signal-containing nuclear protein-like [Centruroides vittatus]|uniref:PEST proteolytic signal-containing nuclear protein-like n=1 Tax=Centruroides sculpturatus TaxID=218467 RepID=UPI000C6DBB05|nr:PEST proteolytic signal-containing nuclear protein-like [Centruroides sculpturatus]
MYDEKIKMDVEGNKLEGLENNKEILQKTSEDEVKIGSVTSTSDTEKRKLDKDEDSGGGGSNGAGIKKHKISMGFSRTFGSVTTHQEKKNPSPITIKLGNQKSKDSTPALKETSASVAEAFRQDSDEEEEMPPEAKMRMRNIGRDTPTSAGPNSYGKTRQGFCDAKKVFERQLRQKMEEVADK